MVRPFRRWPLFTTFFLLILLGYTFLMPSVRAVEITTGEKVLTVLKDVVGLDMATYRINITNYDCFIGFENASMPLTQISNHTNVIYMWWLYRVIVYLTYYHYTIMEALDHASMYYFNLPFYETELAKGFVADWPEYPGWPAMPPSSGRMRIYGNPIYGSINRNDYTMSVQLCYG